MSKQLYDSYHLNFTTTLPRTLLEDLAQATVRNSTSHLVSSIYDQHLAFHAYDSSNYGLGLDTDFFSRMNDPGVSEFVIENLIDKVVAGLFSLIVTLGALSLSYSPCKVNVS